MLIIMLSGWQLVLINVFNLEEFTGVISPFRFLVAVELILLNLSNQVLFGRNVNFANQIFLISMDVPFLATANQ